MSVTTIAVYCQECGCHLKQGGREAEVTSGPEGTKIVLYVPPCHCAIGAAEQDLAAVREELAAYQCPCPTCVVNRAQEELGLLTARRVRDAWCECPDQDVSDTQYYRRENGAHGWACTTCWGIRQTG